MNKQIQEASRAVEQLQALCMMGIKVDPVGPVDAIMGLIDSLPNKEQIAVNAELVASLTEHFSPSERLTPERIGAIQDLASSVGKKVGVLAAEAQQETMELADDRIGRIYLSGPMTGIKDFNFPAFNAAAAELRSLGFKVINPAEHGVVEEAEWGDYLRHDIAKLVTCETIALMPGWENSKGANLELDVAKRLGMRVKVLDGAAFPQKSSQEQKASCWDAVTSLLDEVVPDWAAALPGSRMSMALDAIRDLARRAGEVPAQLYSDDDEKRADLIGHNSNDGLHYLPDGLSWDDAPEWATVLLRSMSGVGDAFVWAEAFEDGARAEAARGYWRHTSIGVQEGIGWALIASRSPAVVTVPTT